MRINDGSLNSSAAETAHAQELQRTGRESAARSGGTAASGNGDHVELSNALGTLARVLSSFGSGRASRVQALAAQYQSGQYQPDALATSRAMVADAMAGGNG
jgi:hypothetical protein